MTETGRIKKARIQTEQAKAALSFVGDMLRNPVISMVGGIVLVNELSKKNVISQSQAYVVQAAIVTPAFFQALAPIAGLLTKL